MYGYGISNQSVERFFIKKKIKYQVLKSNKESLDNTDFDIIIKSPGIPFNDEFLNLHQDKPIISDLELFIRFYPHTFIIGITGTVGKTTTVLLLEHLLKNHYKTQIGGNIGIPLFDLDDTNNFNNEILIIECSSYMLASTINFHPNIMIITNIFPNHLDHHLTKEHYYLSKLKSIVNMDQNDYLLIPKELNNLVENKEVKKFFLESLNNFKLDDDKLYYFNKLISSNYSKVFSGKHNLYNLWYALKTCELLEIKILDNCLDSFIVPEYRLSKIYSDDYLTIINDSKSTNFYSLISAIESIKDLPSIIHWIGGGASRNEDWHELKEFFKNIDIAFLYGENKEDIKKVLEEEKIPFILGDTLKEVINRLVFKKEKTIILFSPGSPSTDQYTNFIERGIDFNELIFKKINYNKNA